MSTLRSRLLILPKVLTDSLCFDKSIGKKIVEREAWCVEKGLARVWRDEIHSCLGIYIEHEQRLKVTR